MLAEDTLTYAQIGQAIGGRSENAIQCRVKCLRKQKAKTAATPSKKLGTPTATCDVSDERMVMEFTAPKRIHTLEEALELCKADLTVWEVDRFVCNTWEVGAKNKEGNIVVEPLYQVKVWFRRNRIVAAVTRFIDMFERAAQNYAPTYAPIVRTEIGRHMAVIPLPDPHFGKYAWEAETGADYDVETAEKLWKDAGLNLLPKAQTYGLEKIFLVVGNDLLNSDNPQGTTTGGTPQDNDTRIQKVLMTAAMSFVWLIEQARLVAPVEVIAVPGNHDALTSYTVAMFLWAWFRNCEDVTVDITPAKTKFIEYGNNLVMLTHGDTLKLPKVALFMATEASVAWGRTKYWEALTGHLHHEQANDYNGVIVRTCKALCAPDAWHKANAYLGRRGAEAFIYERDTGPCGHLIYNVPR